MPKLLLYDPLFNHRAIIVKVGLIELYRLWKDGYYVAYYKTDGDILHGYYIIRCPKCRYNFLAAIKDHADLSWGCPVCNAKL